MKIDKKNKVPYYHQIYCAINSRIKDGEVKVGDSLPSEKELCDYYDVSRTTVRLALRELESEELITRERGRGTYIKKSVETKFLQNFSSTVDELQKRGVSSRIKVLNNSIIDSTEEIANSLKISKKDKVIFIKRLISSNNQPLYFTEAYYPYDIFKKISNSKIIKKSFTKIIHEDYNIEVLYSKRTIEPDIPNKRIIKLLELKKEEQVIIYMQTLLGFKYKNTKRFIYGKEFFNKNYQKFTFERISNKW